MNDRDKLAQLIDDVIVDAAYDGRSATPGAISDAILAAGWRKPREISIEELGDLETPGIVVRDAEGRVAELSKDEGFGNVWKPTMPDTWQDTKFGLEACMFEYPVTVLYTPGEPR